MTRHTILESDKYLTPGCVPTTVVLVQLSGTDTAHDEFVTWVQCWDEQDQTQRAGTVWGHYFDNLKAAITDYEKREAENAHGKFIT